MTKRFALACLSLASLVSVHGQPSGNYNLPRLLREDQLVNTSPEPIQVSDDPGRQAVSAHGIVWLKDVHFREGTLDIDLRGKDVFLKSFLGLAFHGIDTGNYETVYFRPFNFRHADTLRRKWSVQYMSMPDEPYDKLRKEHPLVYENAVDPVPDPTDWFHATIVIRNDWVSVYVNHSPKASLQVRAAAPLQGDLLGLWADELSGDFANLSVSAAEPQGGSAAPASHGDNAAPTQAQPTYTVVNRTLVKGSEPGSVHMNEANEEGIAWINGRTMTDGNMEFDVRGEDVPQHSFVGIAFHGAGDNNYEAVYFRPFNFRSVDSLHRTHAVQYVAAPDYGWERLRTEFPGKYEQPLSPSPDPSGWFHVRVNIKGPWIKVFVNGGATPVLVVKSLVNTGGKKIGLWVGDGSGGDWKNVRVGH